MKRKRRVLIHLKDDGLPSIEGIISRKGLREYTVEVPSLLVSPHAAPAELQSRALVVPRENVAFYELL